MKTYMYIAIRRDLSTSQQTVQSVHAAIEASKKYHDIDVEHPSVIVLGVKTLDQLNKFKEYVNDTNLDYKCFNEPDRDNEMTSVAIYPVTENQRRFFKKYRLL